MSGAPHNPAWFHVVATTYGQWLPGDPRGFRTRHHREHVDGDYKCPPPKGAHDGRLRAANRAMRRSPVRLSAEATRVVLETFVASFAMDRVSLRAIAVAPTHAHVVARFPVSARRPGAGDTPWIGSVRDLVGRAKRRSARALTRQGLAQPGGVWATRCGITRIRDAAHLGAAARYVLRHAEEGALVRSFGALSSAQAQAAGTSHG